MERVSITCDKDAKPMQPAMADCVPHVSRVGIVACDVEKMILRDVTITGYEGEMLTLTRVGAVE